VVGAILASFQQAYQHRHGGASQGVLRRFVDIFYKKCWRRQIAVIEE